MDEQVGSPDVTRPSRRWLVELTAVVIVAVVGIVAHFVVLGRVLRLERDQAAWESAADERLTEEQRLDDSLLTRQARMKTLEGDIEAAAAIHAEKLKELSGLQTSLTALSAELEGKRKDRDKAEAAEKASSAEVERLLALQKQTMQNIDRLSGEQEACQSTLRNLTRDLAEKTALENQLSVIQQKVAEGTARIAEQNNLLGDLAQQEQNARARIRPLEEQATELKAVVGGLNGNIGRAQAELLQAETAMKRLRTEETTLLPSVAQLEEQKKSFSEDVAQLQQKERELAKAKADLLESIAGLEARAEAAKTETARAGALLAQSRTEVDSLAAQKVALRKDISELQSDLQKAQDEKDTVVAERQQLELKLEVSIAELRERHGALEASVADLVKKKGELETARDGLQVTVAGLEAQQQTTKTKSVQAAAALEQTKGEIGDLTARKSSLREDITQLGDDLQKLRTQKDGLQAQSHQLEMAIITAKAKLAALEESAEATGAKLDVTLEGNGAEDDKGGNE